ncbi:MAG: hypothetical protein CME65_12715 [Halobacteriovoraceae bacterium]|nr:hypothetical protein [Halobacteriovoraceae bacterium]|tara:strand:+ start:6846 stop:7292 length:447 start_codon:yes stop_codon:yes gene_type:complete
MIEKALKDKIIELESLNMKPILEASGIKFELKRLLENLEIEQSVVTLFKGDALIALLRYKVQEDSTAFIYSIQIRNPNENKLLVYHLLKKALPQFEEENIKDVVSVVQRANSQSIKFNKKLGLTVEKEMEKAIRYRGAVETLKKRLRI